MELVVLKRAKACIIAIAACCALVTQSATAEPAQRITADPIANAFFAGYEVLEDQPGCNGPHEVAYEMDETLEDIGFRLMDVASRSEQFAGSQNQNFCTRTTRRGNEESTIEVDCAPGDPTAVNSNTFGIDAKMDLTIVLIACVSPTSHDVIGGSWSAIITEGGYATTSSGQIFDQRSGQTFRPTRNGRFIVSKRSAQFGVWADIVQGNDLRYNSRNGDRGFGPITPLNSRPALIGMVECLPFNPPSNPLRSLVADVPFVIFPVDDQPEICTGPDCLIFDDRKVFDGNLKNCEPPSQ